MQCIRGLQSPKCIISARKQRGVLKIFTQCIHHRTHSWLPMPSLLHRMCFLCAVIYPFNYHNAWRIRQNFVKISKKIRYGTRLIMEQDFFVGSSGKQWININNGLSKFGEGKRDRQKTRQENKFQNYYQYHKFILIHKF